MNYVYILNIIFSILGAGLTLYLLHFVFFGFCGLFHRKRFPHAKRLCRYGIVVSCKDEENVIGRLIASIRVASYPQEKLDIFVIAHNCSDSTAEVAARLGAKVIVDDNKEETTLGQAYHYAFPRIENRLDYDGFIVFNADNTVKKDYFQKLNDAFVYYGCKATVTTFRNALNMDSGPLAAAYGLYFGVDMMLAFQGREDLNVNSRITGCGFVMPSSKVKDGWDCLSITEDMEYSANASMDGEEIHFCADAVFFDEQPTKLKTMWNQRLRWSKGSHLISRRFFLPLLKRLFRPGERRKASTFVSLTLHSEIVLVSLGLFLLQALLLLLSPCFGVNLHDAFLHYDQNLSFFQNMFGSMYLGALFSWAKGAAVFLLSGWLVGGIAYFLGRKEYKGFKVGNMLLGLLILPLFLALQYPIDATTLLSREVKWVKIAHGDGPNPSKE